MLNYFNTTLPAVLSEYVPADWKNAIIAGCLLAYLPIFVFHFAGKMIIDGFNNFKSFYKAVVEFLPYFDSTFVKFIECFRLMIGTFWLMFAILIVSPLYPIFLVACAIGNTIWGLGERAFYWIRPKKVIYTVTEPESIRRKSVQKVNPPQNSHESVEMTWNGPVVPTLTVE